MIAKTLKLLFVLALIFAVGWLLYQSSTIILYVIFSAIVALIGKPVYQLFDKISIKGKHIPDVIKSVLTIIAIFGFLSLIAGIFFPMILAEAQLLANIDMGKIEGAIEPAVDWLNGIAANFGIDEQHFDEAAFFSYLFSTVDMSLIPNIFNSLVGAFGNFLVALFSIAFISFFFIRDQEMLSRLILTITPAKLEPSTKNIISNTRKTLSRYFIGLVLQILAITTCIFIGLSLLGVKNALLIAFFTGVVNLVPYLGPWIGATFGIFILLANNMDASFTEVIQPKLLGLIGVFAATQMLDNYLFQPTIFSNSINAHPLEIFLVILVAGTIGGVGGMIAAIPVYSFIRIVFIEMNREFKWLEKLKSDGLST